MRTFNTHLTIIFALAVMGAGLFLWESMRDSSGGLFGRHFASTLYFLSLIGYALLTSIVVLLVARYKRKRQQAFTIRGVIFTHIITVVIAIFGYDIITDISHTYKYANMRDKIEHQKQALKNTCPDLSSWQWITLSSKQALVNFTFRGKADTTINLKEFYGYHSGHYYRLHSNSPKNPLFVHAQQETNLSAVVSIEERGVKAIDSRQWLLLECENAYLNFTSYDVNQAGAFGFRSEIPVYIRIIPSPQELTTTAQHLKMANQLLTVKPEDHLVDQPKQLESKYSNEELSTKLPTGIKYKKHQYGIPNQKILIAPPTNASDQAEQKANDVKLPDGECIPSLMKCP